MNRSGSYRGSTFPRWHAAFCFLVGLVCIAGLPSARAQTLDPSSPAKENIYLNNRLLVIEEAGASFSDVGPSAATPPPLANWTKVDSGNNATAGDLPGGVFIQSPANTTPYLKILYRAAPGAPFTLTARFQVMAAYKNYSAWGLVLGDNNGKWETYGYAFVNGLLSFDARWNSDTSWSSDRKLGPLLAPEDGAYHRLVYDGTNVRYQVSATGLAGTFLEYVSHPATSWLAAITRVGFAADKGNGSINEYPVHVTLNYWNITTP